MLKHSDLVFHTTKGVAVSLSMVIMNPTPVDGYVVTNNSTTFQFKDTSSTLTLAGDLENGHGLPVKAFKILWIKGNKFGVEEIPMALKMKDGTKPAATYMDHLASKPVVAKMQTATKMAGEQWSEEVEKTEVINPGVMLPKDEMMQLHYEGGQTINMGNFNSAKFTVGVTMPTTKDTLAADYDWVTDWVSAKIAEAAQGIKG